MLTFEDVARGTRRHWIQLSSDPRRTLKRLNIVERVSIDIVVELLLGGRLLFRELALDIPEVIKKLLRNVPALSFGEIWSGQ